MIIPTVYLVAEDQLGLAVGRKLISEVPPLTLYREKNGHGFGTLKREVTNYHQIGKHMPVLMLTDLDNAPCASALIDDWLGCQPSTGFLFRVCVHEIEAWLMADRRAFAAFLRLPIALIPYQPEALSDPKTHLLQLAGKAPKRIRTALLPSGTATIGPEYNDFLSSFIRDAWDPEAAAHAAPSLARTRRRLQQLATIVAG
jgi:hypothetical protein